MQRSFYYWATSRNMLLPATGLFSLCLLYYFSQVFEIRLVNKKTESNHVYARRRSQLAEVFVNDQGELVIPEESILNQTDMNDLQEIYHRYVESIQVRCRSQIHLGNELDGGYHVCEDTEVAPIKPCLVYSFGIHKDFSFDDAISQQFGCKVHSFDPSDGVEDHKHSENVWFHNTGIGGTNTVNSKGWNIKTLGTIRKELNHDKRQLDILKIDVEGAEFESLAEMVQTGSIEDVRQLLVEFHVKLFSESRTSRNEYISHLTLLRNLYKLRFRIFYFRMWNTAKSLVFEGGGVSRTGCHEVHFIRVSD